MYIVPFISFIAYKSLNDQFYEKQSWNEAMERDGEREREVNAKAKVINYFR